MNSTKFQEFITSKHYSNISDSSHVEMDTYSNTSSNHHTTRNSFYSSFESDPYNVTVDAHTHDPYNVTVDAHTHDPYNVTVDAHTHDPYNVTVDAYTHDPYNVTVDAHTHDPYNVTVDDHTHNGSTLTPSVSEGFTSGNYSSDVTGSVDVISEYTTDFDNYVSNLWIDTTPSTFISESIPSFPITNASNFLLTNWTENLNFTNRSLFEDVDSPQLSFPIHVSNLLNNGNSRIDSSAETVVKVFVLALVSIFGSIGNFLVVGSIIKSRHLHRPPFYFLLSMGVTDLARSGFCLPVVMATALQGSIWRHGPTACKMFAFAASFFVFSSALSLLTIAVERHLSIVYAKAYRRRCHGFINLFATLFIWATAFCISFPPVFSIGVGEYIFISEEAQCTYAHKHYSHNDGLNSVLIFIAITSLTYFLYYRIFIFMRSHRRMRPLQHRPAFSTTWTFVGPGANGQAFINWLNGFGGHTTNYARQAPAGHRSVQRLNFGRVMNLSTTKNEHLTRLFLIMTLVYGVTWLPYVVLSLWRVFLDASKIPASFMTYAAWLSYSQVALCPLTYFLSRGRIRNTSRIVQMDSSERSEFLLENKIGK